MNAYKLFWLCLKAIVRGHGKAPVFFDTDARKFDYHMAHIARGYCQEVGYTEDERWWITLHED